MKTNPENSPGFWCESVYRISNNRLMGLFCKSASAHVMLMVSVGFWGVLRLRGTAGAGLVSSAFSFRRLMAMVVCNEGENS